MPDLTFRNIYEQMGPCQGHERLVVASAEDQPENVRFKVLEPPKATWIQKLLNKTPKIDRAAQHRENIQAHRTFIKLLRNEGTRGREVPAELIHRLEQVGQTGAALTAATVQEVYRRVVSNDLDGIRKTACLAQGHARIVFRNGEFQRGRYITDQQLRLQPDALTAQENREAITQYLLELHREWGQQRVYRALQHSGTDLVEMMRDGQPLLAKHVNHITLDLADYHEDNLKDFHQQVKAICAGTEGAKVVLSRRQKEAIEAHKTEADADHYSVLRRLFADNLHSNLEDLPPHLYQLIFDASHCSPQEIDGMLQGRRLGGAITGYPLVTGPDLIYSRRFDNRERIQLYELICRENVSQDMYDELLAKALVKKRMTKGTLIPRYVHQRDGKTEIELYRVKEVIRTERGKLAYHLVAANSHSEKLDDILLYRSTSSNPSMEDGATTVLQDINPIAPPGYLWNQFGQNYERKVFFDRGLVSPKPLRVIGHSLGGSHAQLSIISRILGVFGPKDDLPLRPIKVVTFDAPALTAYDALRFAHWTRNPRKKKLAANIEITHHFSNGDRVPGAGAMHLGYGVRSEEGNPVKASCADYTCKRVFEPRIDYHPHGRFYLWTKEGVDYEKKVMPISEYDDASWRRVTEIGRRILGLLLFPITFLATFAFRLGYDSKVRERVYNRAIENLKLRFLWSDNQSPQPSMAAPAA